MKRGRFTGRTEGQFDQRSKEPNKNWQEIKCPKKKEKTKKKKRQEKLSLRLSRTSGGDYKETAGVNSILRLWALNFLRVHVITSGGRRGGPFIGASNEKNYKVYRKHWRKKGKDTMYWPLITKKKKEKTQLLGFCWWSLSLESDFILNNIRSSS